MSTRQFLIAGYLIGGAIFIGALVLILIRLIVGETRIDPGLPLIGGFLLMFGAKLVLITHRGARD